MKLLESGASEDCGCPEELWQIGNLAVLIHLEADGDGHVIVYGGDFEYERNVSCRGIEDLRVKAKQIVEGFPVE
ncbi:hypothetical protein [Roseovarius sp. MMSF_3350]|uniref:hypothetical protein n=1 Tax=Roseovarius sp. MMSF_3350 TaxID=3046706 RepID=UPI0027400143|nr:hypothetical protein [Roseovarius sp. MMSF_3350]